MNKKDIKNIWLLIIFFILVLTIVLNVKYRFGNTANFVKELDALISMKKNFLETKKIIPTFINDGKFYINSYNFMKYGLVNPIVIISYFININLADYYSIVSIISIGIGIILLYKFLFNQGFNRYSVLLTIMLLVVSTKVYTIMFNSIMDCLVFPIVILSFIGAKNRLENNKSFLLSISILLLSIINYLYVIPTIIGLIVYGFYHYYENNKKLLFKKFFWYILYYIIPILVGLLLSSFVLIPVINNIDWEIINYLSISYDINIIIILSIIYAIFGSKKNRFLSIILLFFLVLFNNYYIGYLVLLSLVVNNFMDGIIKNKVDYKILLLGVLISLVCLLINSNNLIVMIILLLSVFIYKDTNKKEYLLFIIIMCIFVNTILGSLKMDLYNKDFVVNYNSETNVLYNMLIGQSKSNNEMSGYDKVINDQGEIYYKNNDVLYKGFATNNIISYEDYEKLNGLAKQEVMLTNIVADTNSRNEYVSYVKDINVKEKKYDISVKDVSRYIFKLEKKDMNKIIYIEFEASTDNCEDGRIKINNVDNYISCKQEKYSYTISDKNTEEIVVTISKGKYKIKNIRAYSLDYARVNNSKIELDEFVILHNSSSIIGKIQASGDGYFMITIPYDRGYEVKVDNTITKYEKVDGNFIGVPIKKGKHIISINYETKYRLTAWFFSYLGFVFMFFINYIEKKRKFT